MKKFLTGLMVVALGICFCAGTLVAGEKGKEAKKSGNEFKGTVQVVKDGDTVKSITIAGKDGKTYTVVLDDKSKGLVALNGKNVVIHGTEADGKLTVTEFKEKADKTEKGKEDKKQ